MDLEVISTYVGEGKYDGLLGGVVVDFKGKQVNVGGGFSDPDRWKWAEKRDQLIGRIAEVKAQEVTKHGSLRNPIFLRWRDDK